MCPLFRRKHMKRVLGSEYSNRVRKGGSLLEKADHLDNTMFRCRLCKVQLPVWMAKFPQRRRCLHVAPQYKVWHDAVKGVHTR